MKKIVFTVTTAGCDGMGKSSDVFASYFEERQIEYYNNHIDKNYYSLSEKIIDVESETDNLFRKLSSIDKLILGLDQE